ACYDEAHVELEQWLAKLPFLGQMVTERGQSLEQRALALGRQDPGRPWLALVQSLGMSLMDVQRAFSGLSGLPVVPGMEAPPTTIKALPDHWRPRAYDFGPHVGVVDLEQLGPALIWTEQRP